MKPHETGTRHDLIEHRFHIAEEDLETAYLLLDAKQYRGVNNTSPLRFSPVIWAEKLLSLKKSDMQATMTLSILLQKIRFRCLSPILFSHTAPPSPRKPLRMRDSTDSTNAEIPSIGSRPLSRRDTPFRSPA